MATGNTALTVPTGKATYRIGEVIQASRHATVDSKPTDQDLTHLPELCTLHRLLGYQHYMSRYTHHENNRLSKRVIIGDESSMIDLALVEQFVRELRDDCRFILFGDDHQIPFVKASAVVRDSITAGQTNLRHSPQSVRLSNSH